MRKKLISVLLAAAVVLGFIPLISMANSNTGQTTIGEYNYTLVSDPDSGIPPTDDIVAGGFGDRESNGRIWTDKSVFVNDEGDGFNVDLKVLAQEYVSTEQTTEKQSIAADVLMIFDMTTSMNNTLPPGGDGEPEGTRLQGLVDAANNAIDIITKANTKNRVNIYGYGGTTRGATLHSILPLGHYESTVATETEPGEYLVYSNNKILLSDTLIKDGEAYRPGTTSFSEVSGTGTQFGIAASSQQFLSYINSETDNSDRRKPYVILMTDGEPTWANRNWWSEDMSVLKSTDRSTTGGLVDRSTTAAQLQASTSDRNQIISALTVLTAACWRDRIEDAYNNYNNDELGVEWFNIGLGVDEDPDYTGCLLNPDFMKEVEASNASGSTEAQRVKYYLNYSYFGAPKHPDYPDKDYYTNDAYIYPVGSESYNEGSGYVTFAESYSVLQSAFDTLASIIERQSSDFIVPIVHQNVGDDTTSDVVFTDVIGKGMSVTDIKLTQNKKPEPIEGVYDSTKGVYTFAGYETTVKITEASDGQQTLEWHLPAREVAMFTFTDRNDLENSPLTSANPTVLTFGLEFTDEIGAGPAYTNDFDGDPDDPSTITPKTTVTYEIPGDNTFYFKDEDHGGGLKNTSELPSDVTHKNKTANTTGSSGDVGDYTYTASTYEVEVEGVVTTKTKATVNGVLGNNGKVTGVLRPDMNIVIEKKWRDKKGNQITDTQDLPEIDVNLYRKTDGGSEELVEGVAHPIKLNNGNQFRAGTYTVPIRDSNNNRYTYYIKEDCPADYYIESMSAPLKASDGTLTVINREVPDKGLLTVNKQWLNKLGSVITDTSSLPDVNINLKRNEETGVLKKCNVTIYVTAPINNNVGAQTKTYTEYQKQFEVPVNAAISFKLKVYFTSERNANAATLTLNNNEVNATTGNLRSVYGYNPTNPFIDTPELDPNNRWYKETDLQSFTITEDTTLNYVVGERQLNLTNFPRNITSGNNTYTINPYMVQTLRMTLAEDYEDSDITQRAQGRTGLDYESLTLNSFNVWEKSYRLNQYEVDPIDNYGDDYIVHCYKYYVEEEAVPGYNTYYSANNSQGVTEGTITVTNKEIGKIGPLPETGGRTGPDTIRIAGFLFMLLPTAFFIIRMYIPVYKKRRRSEN